MSSDEVKQRIIFQTIELIENVGIPNLTIRKIAEAAGVNVAAVNYHFGSKEQLVEIAMNSTLQESFVNNINDYEGLWQTDPKQALQSFLEHTLQGAINYPNLTKAHFAKIFSQNDYQQITVTELNNFLSKFRNLISSVLRSEEDEKNRLAVVQVFSVILMTGMMPELFNSFLEFDLHSAEKQQLFIQTLIDNFVK